MTTADDYTKLSKAACNNDLDTIKALLNAGFDKESIDEYGEPIFSDIVFNLLEEQAPHRYDMVKSLIELGFDPHNLDTEGSGAITHAMLSMDTEMLQVLIEGGARPNETSGFKANETLYDWASFDYIYQIWGGNKYPQQPPEKALSNEDSWLQWINEIAEKQQRRCPDHLLLLRKLGARGGEELKQTH